MAAGVGDSVSYVFRRRRRKRQESADASPAEEEKDTEPETKEDERDGGEDTDDCEVCPGTCDGAASIRHTNTNQSQAAFPPETPSSDVNHEAGDASGAQVTRPQPGAEQQAEPDGFGPTGSSDAGDVEPRSDPAPPERRDVDCPICQGSFPASEIELHAAYCDGEVAIVDERGVGPVCLPSEQNLCRPVRPPLVGVV